MSAGPEGEAPWSRGGEQPLDLGLVGNCLVSALVDPRGRVSWMGWPRLDGDPVFCALLDGTDPGAGFLEVVPRSLDAQRQRYRRNTAILETELRDAEGSVLRIVDFCPRARRVGRPVCPPYLVRRIEPVSGQPLVTIRLRPRFDWGRAAPERHLGGNALRFTGPGQTLRATTDASVVHVAAESPFVLDRPVTLILGPDEAIPGPPGAVAEDWLRETEADWLDWSRGLNIPFEWQEPVIRSAITLKLCAFEETGGVVAAMTTSIPEAPVKPGESGRNWDYRYCWPRDTAFTVAALNALGTTHTMERFLLYLETLVRLAQDGPEGAVLHPVYALVPTLTLPEREAEGLAGFLGMGPVRVGNQAAEQVQHDSYGSVILAVSQAFFDHRLRHPVGEPMFRLLEHLGERAERVALEPDAGLWEYRGRERVHTYSAAMCWAALDRLGAIARHLGLPREAARWAAAADRLHAEVDRLCWSEELGAYTEAVGSEGMDAALLLLPRIGFVEARSPRFLGTLARIEERLLRDGFLMRYDMEDDFGAPETAFLLCSFWYADALVEVGRAEEARDVFERVLARRNRLGLLSEDLDARTGRLWGNFPQAYSHVGLILSAFALSRSWPRGLRGEE